MTVIPLKNDNYCHRNSTNGHRDWKLDPPPFFTPYNKKYMWKDHIL